jgi:hypothetical protein
VSDERNQVASPDWVSKVLATVDSVSGYTFAALAIAGALVILLPSPIVGVDLAPIAADHVVREGNLQRCTGAVL